MSVNVQIASEILDPNAKQNSASDPSASIWVSASAGTGKTKVLTDRVLRLMLPRDDGRPATAPHKILCLTYTKAAAGEMAQRINSVLGQWSVLPLTGSQQEEKSLTAELEKLFGKQPTHDQLRAAQKLFAHVMDCPGGLQIMTIHSFCTSVLGRFPLEAGLSPHFKGMDEDEASEIMAGAMARVLSEARRLKGSDLSGALDRLSAQIPEDTFKSLLLQLSSERYQLQSVFKRYKDAQGIYTALCAFYGIAAGRLAADFIRDACEEGHFDAQGLLHLCDAFDTYGGKIECSAKPVILDWVKADHKGRIAAFEDYYKVFITGGSSIRKQGFPTKATLAGYPDALDIITKEGERLLGVTQQAAKALSASLTRDLLLIGFEILKAYESIKHQRGVLDFSDMIIRTLELLRGESHGFSELDQAQQDLIPAWVMYKMDQGLDHILIDEAQDTNPEQWQIIESLCQEFFSGFGARDDVLRTVFTVGDVKQSIYGFQRAAPEEFKRMQSVMQKRISDSGLVSASVGLDISFRSTQDVLDVVDHVFSEEEARIAVGEDHIRHLSYRKNDAGLVELWSLFEDVKEEKADRWDLPVQVSEQKNAPAQLAKYIAAKIRYWLDTKEILPAYDRPVEEGDILILMRTRSKLTDMLVRELKLQKILVSGVDRMVLGDQLAVQDMLAVAKFCLLPEDDLNLGCVLKSPFLGWSDDELFSLSYKRKTTLWAELHYFDETRLLSIEDRPEDFVIVRHEKREKTKAYLSSLITMARHHGVYDFFSAVLQKSCPVVGEQSGLQAMQGRLGEDALDPLDELLNAALGYARKDIDNLQLFIEWLERQDIQIKREMEEGGAQVRIMTVHGSKGLQAPIVIMPDTTEASRSSDSLLLWPSKTGLDFPVWTPRSGDAPKEFQSLLEYCQLKNEEEKYRLLYVAMTRAADRLYVCGYTAPRRKKDGSWYAKIEQAMRSMDGVVECEDGALRYAVTTQGERKNKKDANNVGRDMLPIPSWVYEEVAPEPIRAKPLRPSVGGEGEKPVAVLSPLRADQEYRFLRGNLTHKLLQYLPQIKPSLRESAARMYLDKNGGELSDVLRSDVIREVIAILENPEFAPFFAENALAEVPITAVTDGGKVISGQIDRLVVGDDKIWILDYKTNRPPPQRVEDVPKIYLQQMQAYRETIAKIYPAREIICGLLWTDGARLMVL